MARGWESKSVESQIESARARAGEVPERMTPEQLSRQHERESLELTRTRVVHDLNAATHPRHRESLQLALKFLDDKIAALM